MATNVGYEILVDSSVSADNKAEILKRTLQVLSRKTLSITYAATYSAGTTSANQVGIEVTGASEDYGIRITMDSAVVGTNEVATILRQLIQVHEMETVTLVHAAAYTAGDRAYNVTIAVS